MAFPAKYEGTCGDCGQPFGRGVSVTYQGPLGVCHMICPNTANVCPKCHMALPVTGVCDDCT